MNTFLNLIIKTYPSSQKFFKNITKDFSKMDNATQHEIMLTLRDKPDDLLFTLDDINLKCVLAKNGDYRKCDFNNTLSTGY